jgi:hypothetical protein
MIGLAEPCRRCQWAQTLQRRTAHACASSWRPRVRVQQQHERCTDTRDLIGARCDEAVWLSPVDGGSGPKRCSAVQHMRVRVRGGHVSEFNSSTNGAQTHATSSEPASQEHACLCSCPMRSQLLASLPTTVHVAAELSTHMVSTDTHTQRRR